jgi:hypothetical protein
MTNTKVVEKDRTAMTFRAHGSRTAAGHMERVALLLEASVGQHEEAGWRDRCHAVEGEVCACKPVVDKPAALSAGGRDIGAIRRREDKVMCCMSSLVLEG